MKIMKFGGSSISTPDKVRNVLCIISDTYRHYQPLAVVFSAFGGATCLLQEMCNKAAQGDNSYISLFQDFERVLELCL